MREKAFQFDIEMSHQGLVMGDDDGGFAQIGNHICHGEGLARSGHPQKGLVFFSLLHSLGQLRYGLGLIPFGLIIRN